jgi:hypothetical protein
MERILSLLDQLQELLDERDEKQEMLDDETQAGNAHEADGHAEDLADLIAEIEAINANVERELRSL